MNTHILERSFNPFDLLFRNLFESEAAFIPAEQAKQQYPINIFEDDLGLTFELACTGIPKEAIEVSNMKENSKERLLFRHEKHTNFILL